LPEARFRSSHISYGVSTGFSYPFKAFIKITYLSTTSLTSRTVIWPDRKGNKKLELTTARSSVVARGGLRWDKTADQW